MVALTELSGCFERPSDDARPWRLDNPLPVPTEQERYVLEQGLPVYRVLYRQPSGPSGAHRPGKPLAGDR